jgi:hypothetical protein
MRIAATVRGYTSAVAIADGHRACGYLSAAVIAQAVAMLGATWHAKACVGLLKAMFGHVAPQARAASRHTDVTAVRVSGTKAFAFFRQPGGPTQFYSLVIERGVWKVAALGSTTLPPR